MKIARFAGPEGKVSFGIVRGQEVCRIEGDILGKWKETKTKLPLSGVKLLPPVQPVNMLCFGRNYKAHAEEGGSDLPENP